MFNQFSQRRQFTPSTPPRPLPGQTSIPSGNSSFAHQIRPDFASQANPTPTGMQRPAQTNDITAARMSRTQADAYQRMSPQSQRAALYNQARQQAVDTHQMQYQQLRNPAGALPGGLTEKQRTDFQMLQRSNPAAAQQQLMQYQRTADIRYNKPVSGPPTPQAGPTYRPSNPSSFNGPRRSFGA